MSKPEPLKLADLLDSGADWVLQEAAAAELRRLYAVNRGMLSSLREIERSTYDAVTAALVRVAIARAEEQI